MTIGGSPADANTFLNFPQSSLYLVLLDFSGADVNAEYNNWGFCTRAEIETWTRHKPDKATLGTVDFEPFISPAGCPRTFGDLNCDGQRNALDVLGPLTFVAEVDFEQQPFCPVIDEIRGTAVASDTPRHWGDINCSGSVTLQDTIALLDAFEEIDYAREEGCPNIDDEVSLSK